MPESRPRYEFVAVGPTPSDSSGSSNCCLAFLQTAGGAALITVILGGIVGGILNGQIQQDLSRREHRQALQAARLDTQLLMDRNFLEAQTTATQQLLSSIGEYVSRIQSRAVTKGPEFKAGVNTTSEQKEKLDAQRDAALQAYNSALEAWVAKVHSSEFILRHYYDNDQDVISAWQKVLDKVDAYSEFASNLKTERFTRDCWKPPEDQVTAAVSGLSDAMSQTRSRIFDERLERLDEP